MSVSWTSLPLDSGGLREREFVLSEADTPVSGVAWLPVESRPNALVLLGHGFTTHKRCDFQLPIARRLAREYGICAAAIDAPCHGDRARLGATPEKIAEDYLEYWRTNGGHTIAQELRATSEGLLELPEIGEVPLGYWGLSLGTQYGLEFLASSQVVQGAVLGLFGLVGPRVARSASGVRCPVFFVRQLDDELHTAESSRLLFDRIGSTRKKVKSSTGAHAAVPAEAIDSALAFLVRTLEAAV